MSATIESTTHDRVLLNVSEIARMLGISERKVWELASTGELRPVKLGRSTRWRAADIEKFVRALSERAA